MCTYKHTKLTGVGAAVGARVGAAVGEGVGARVGVGVGSAVGAWKQVVESSAHMTRHYSARMHVQVMYRNKRKIPYLG